MEALVKGGLSWSSMLWCCSGCFQHDLPDVLAALHPAVGITCGFEREG